MSLLTDPIRSAGSLSAGILLTMTVSLMAGCGFQLRGSTPVPGFLQPLAVNCDGSVPVSLCQSVQDQLRLGGVNLTGEENAEYHLSLSDFREERRTSAVTLHASAAEYVIRQSVEVSVTGAEDVILLEKNPVASSESYRYDETDVLAKRQEAEMVRNTLHQRLSSQVLFRLAPLKPPSDNTP